MVSPCYYPVKGGTETVVRNLSISLNKIGVHTDVMTFNMDRKWNPKWQGKTEELDGITVFRIPGLNWLPFAHSYRNTMGVNLIPGRFTNILEDYDIIHFHEFDFSFLLFTYLVRKPKIIHLHGAILSKNPKLYGPTTRILIKCLPDLYITISTQMKDDLQFLGISKEKIVYLPNSIDTRLFTPNREKEDNLLLFVGRITSSKGLHVLLKSLDYLRSSVRLVIIGPTDSDTDYYQNLLKITEKEKRKGKHEIRFLGAMEQGDIISWYRKASIFVLPSFWEGSPVTVIEALSCETPVVATPVGGIPEVVKDDENGILIPPNDPVALARAIQYLLENKEVRTKFGREGRKRIIKYYSLEASVEKLCGIYKQLNS
jgi:glycosyltransferase involved in cell wall biosynthesis